MNRFEDLSRTEIENLLTEYVVGKNAERDRNILERRLIDGLTYERLAEEFDLSTVHVKEIVKKRQEKLFKRLG